VRLGQIVELVLVHVHAAGRNLVQQRLPEMAAGAIHQSNSRSTLAAATERVAEPRCQLQPGSAATDHDDLVQRRIRGLPIRSNRCRGASGCKVSDDAVLGLCMAERKSATGAAA